MDSTKTYSHCRAFRDVQLMLPFHEKILFLFTLINLRPRHIHFLSSVWIFAGIEHNRREGHRRWGKILHLLKGEVEVAEHLLGEGLHIAFMAAGVRGDEVWDELISQSILAADAVKVTI